MAQLEEISRPRMKFIRLLWQEMPYLAKLKDFGQDNEFAVYVDAMLSKKKLSQHPKRPSMQGFNFNAYKYENETELDRKIAETAKVEQAVVRSAGAGPVYKPEPTKRTFHLSRNKEAARRLVGG